MVKGGVGLVATPEYILDASQRPGDHRPCRTDHPSEPQAKHAKTAAQPVRSTPAKAEWPSREALKVGDPAIMGA